MLKNDSNKLDGNDKFQGFCIDLLEEIAEICKINYTIYLVSDGKYGVPNENGQWNGLVKELIEEVS
jgi:ionotropic kainate glutamate receptor 4